MNLQFYIEKLKNSGQYQDFVRKHPEAYLSGGFFVMDLETLDKKGDQQNLDFYIPGKKEMFSFCINEECKKNPVEILEPETIPEDLSMDFDFDFEEVGNLLSKKIEEEGIKNKTQKFLFSMQAKEGKPYLIGTIFFSQLGLAKFKIDLEKKEVSDFEKKSFFDVISFRKKGD